VQDVVIRPGRAADAAAVREVIEVAFGRVAEANLVDRLRLHDDTTILVAEIDGEVGGCIVFSRVTAAAGDLRLAGLAPLAIAPFWQGQGVGTLLVEKGLEDCRTRGIDVVVVLGHPGLYGRFGFSAAHARGIACRWVVPEDAFMVKELTPGALSRIRGVVDYRPEFDEV
jgi:putative acetyltransferase